MGDPCRFPWGYGKRQGFREGEPYLQGRLRVLGPRGPAGPPVYDGKKRPYAKAHGHRFDCNPFGNPAALA